MKKQNILDLLQMDLNIAKTKEKIAEAEWIVDQDHAGGGARETSYLKAQGFTNGVLTAIQTIEALKNWE